MRHYNKRQQGGTLVGIIIGLVIGLAIALAVAVAITKTPMPFTNKMGKHEKQAPPSTAQMADPNGRLYGNNRAASKEAAKSFVKEPETILAAEPKSADKKVEPKVETIAALTPETIEKAKAADAKAAAIKALESKKEAVAKTESVEEKWSYFLQAGAFRDPTDAENTRAKLALMGVEARVMERESENGMLYRVRVGPFAQLDAVNRVRGKLSDNGVDAAVVRVSK